MFQIIQQCAVMNDRVGKEFKRHLAIQFFIARQPDNSHSSLAQDLEQGVAAKDFLPAGVLPLSHIQSGTGSGVTHLVRIIRRKRR
jgi:hypothetical protein